MRQEFEKYIDIKTCDMTLKEVMDRIGELQAEHPDQDIFMDGDLYAVIGIPKEGAQ